MVDAPPRTFAELTDKEKQAVRQAYVEQRDYPHDNWWTYDDFVRVAEILGITFDQRSKSYGDGPAIYFSGFSSQGDGACFSGRYKCAPEASTKIREYAPQDEVLHGLADRLTALQIRTKLVYGSFVHSYVTTRGSYCHSGTMVTSDPRLDIDDDAYADGDQDDIEIESILRAFADWIYKELNDQYDWYFSNEYVDECLSGETFDEDGDMI